MRKAILVATLAALALLCATAEEREAGVVRRGELAFMALAPEGWVWDRRALYREGIEALFRPKGGSFAEARVWATIAPLSYEEWTGSQAADEAGLGAALFELETGSFQRIVFYRAAAAQSAERGYRGVLDAGSGMVLFTLAARSPEELEAARGALEQLVEDFLLLEPEEKP